MPSIAKTAVAIDKAGSARKVASKRNQPVFRQVCSGSKRSQPMIASDYLCEQSAPPTPGARFLHQKAIPAAIDGLAAGEAVFEAAAQRIRNQTLIGVCVAFGIGFVLSMMVSRRGS